MKKGKLLIGACVVFLLAAAVIPPIWTAHCIKEYLSVVNPHFAPYVERLSTYNPVNSNYNMVITDDSGASIFLECELDGSISDKIRAEEYFAENGLSQQYNHIDDSFSTLYCHWLYNDPAEPRLSLLVVFNPEDDSSLADDDAIRVALSQCLLTHYEQLPAAARECLVSCRSYLPADKSYYIDINLSNGSTLTPELLQQSKMNEH